MGERATRSVVIDVPADEWLTSNGRYHWAQKARRTRALRVRAALAARAARIPSMVRARITVHVHGRARALIDGLVDAGVLPDDDAAHLDGPDMRLGDPDSAMPTGRHRLTVDITDTTGDKGRP